jgi:hypothetical protein
MGIVEDYRPPQLRRSPGRRSHSEVIIALQSLVEEELGGFAYDLMPGEFDTRLAVGGVAGVSTRHLGDEPRPCVFVRADVPADLRMDLWGFCTALAVCACDGTVRLDDDGLGLVGLERRPVYRRGPGLLGALLVRRFGGDPGDCDFPVLRQPVAVPNPL